MRPMTLLGWAVTAAIGSAINLYLAWLLEPYINNNLWFVLIGGLGMETAIIAISSSGVFLPGEDE